MSSLNKARFQQFLSQARGANVQEIHVNRHEGRAAVELRFNGRAPKKKVRINGEWSIPRGDKDEEAIKAEVQAFLETARKHFFVHRGDGLEDEAFADTAMEAETKPIVAPEEGKEG